MNLKLSTIIKTLIKNNNLRKLILDVFLTWRNKHINSLFARNSFIDRIIGANRFEKWYGERIEKIRLMGRVDDLQRYTESHVLQIAHLHIYYYIRMFTSI